MRRAAAQLRHWFSDACFKFVHHNNLVYNACWEDPRLDQVALALKPGDRVMVITSAGCNALDYALQGPAHVHAIDVNPRQNALLELKLAGIRALDFEAFFALFGCGRTADPEGLYRTQLRSRLSPFARNFWDRRMKFFAGQGWRRSFYFRGTAGAFARAISFYIDRVAKVRPEVTDLLNASTLDEQQAIYTDRLHGKFWKPFLKWAVRRDATLSLLGVPRPQRLQVDRTYPGGIARFIEDSLETVFTELPLADNYFWRVYMEGQYSRDCCPEYLKPANFAKLKAGLVDRVTTHTTTITRFLETHHGAAITRFVLLDHMDWLATAKKPLLQEEWQAIVNRAAPRSRILWRSGGLKVDFIDPLNVNVQGKRRQVGDLLDYNTRLAEELHAKDRVHTYGSFYIANLHV